MKVINMNVFEILFLRYEYEEIVVNFKIPGQVKHGTLDSMKEFLETGAQKNRFRDGYNRAKEICNLILDNEAKRVPFV